MTQNTSHADYRDFLASKIVMAPQRGFDVSVADINPVLKPHQRDIVRWACAGGRRAVFARFGLGKTIIELEICRLAIGNAGGRALIVLPLGVRQEFIRDAVRLLGWERPPRFIRSISEADEGGVYLTNYETMRDGKLSPDNFTVACLDEASVLRSFGSKTYQEFLPLFANVLYRFVATATPSPNRCKELIHYAGFLGVMDTGQALTRWFQRDSEKAGNLTLYPHKADEFWIWVASWGLFLQRPSDLGYSDEGYDLPPLKVRWHEVASPPSLSIDRDGQGRLGVDAATGLSEEARERRASLPARIAKMRELIETDPSAHRILWHDLEDERRAIEAAVPGSVSVYGSQDLIDREAAIIAFSDGEIKYLAAKPIIAGSGCNFQRHCHKAIFVGVSHKFNDFIQAVHRVYRFLQTSEVEIDIIHSDRDRETVRDLQRKWTLHDETVETVAALIRKHGIYGRAGMEVLTRTIGLPRQSAQGAGWQMIHNDCVEEARSMIENSVDLIVTSVPFANHYEYTPSYNDFGHTDDNDHFFRQMDFLTPDLLRILRPGRLACIHVKDRILFGSVTGMGRPTVSPFHAECIMHYRRHGFAYMGMITVVTDVVRENNQTYRLGYTEMRKDGSKMGVGSPEYILLLAKPQSNRAKGYADERIVKTVADYSLARWQVDAHAFWRSSGDRLATAAELSALRPDQLVKTFTARSLQAVYDYREHVAIGEALEARGALPTKFMTLAPGSNDPDVWHDVARMKTLNTLQAAGGREKHVCPLQLDIASRLIERYSMRGDLVFDPFGGLGTVPYCAIGSGRRGQAAELNADYWRDACWYLRARECEAAVPTLFELIDAEAA